MAFVAASWATGTGLQGQIQIPAAAQVGDIAWMVQVTSDTPVLTTPSGWTSVATGVIGNLRYVKYRRVLTAGQPGSMVNLDISVITKQAIVIAVVDGVDNLTQENSETPAAVGDNTASANRTNPSTTLPGVRDVLAFVFSRGNTPPTLWTPPAGWTYATGAYGSSSGAATCAVAYKNAAPAGPIGGDVWTSNSSDLRGGALLCVVVPTVVVPPTGPTIQIWNGTALENVDLLGVWNGTSIDAVDVLGSWNGTSIESLE